MASKTPYKKEELDESGETPTLEKDPTGKIDASADDHSISSRDRIRAELDDQVAAFLAKGGHIDKVQPHVTADPPKKPGSAYGSRPI